MRQWLRVRRLRHGAHLNCVAHSHQFTNISSPSTVTRRRDLRRCHRMIRDDGTPVDSRNLGRYVDWWSAARSVANHPAAVPDFDRAVKPRRLPRGGERDRQDAATSGRSDGSGGRAAPPEPGIAGSYIAGNIPECWYQLRPTAPGRVGRRAQAAVSAASRASAHLRSLIFDGDLPPGDRADQDAVAATLGISRQPVREAVLELQPTACRWSGPEHGLRRTLRRACAATSTLRVPA